MAMPLVEVMDGLREQVWGVKWVVVRPCAFKALLRELSGNI